MVCKQCGRLLKDDTLICEFCGMENSVPRNTSGVQGRRQGRRIHPVSPARETYVPPAQPYLHMSGKPVQPSPAQPAAQPAAKQEEAVNSVQQGAQEKKVYRVRKVMVNWVMVGLIVLGLIFVGVVGGYVFLKTTDAGQLILARMGKEANAKALWAYGGELLDQGYVDRAIATFEQAYEMDPELEGMYGYLLGLADAYEAGGYIGKAEETYRKMYTEVDKERATAYRAIIRIMTDQDRKMELSTFLTLAYENTGESSFRRQREEMLPSTPTTDLEAGTRMYERDVRLLSEEDYDIYYILGEEGILPEDGTLYQTPIHLAEGIHTLRAVAVSNDLISDEMTVKYNITLPKPTAPYPSLGPGTYEQRQRIRLRYLETEDDKLHLDYLSDPAARADAQKKQNDITMYYTLDGQTPTSNSPVYDHVANEGILMPGGRVTLKAICVNGFGKVSNVLEREYKINNVAFKRFFRSDDTLADITIMKTSKEAFVKKYGQPNEEVEIEDATLRGVKLKLTYNWGEAKFAMMSDGYVLYSLDTGNASMVGPRKTRIGDTEQEVIDQFRDVGQPHDQNGDRSLYWNGDNNGDDWGKLFHLDDTHDRIDYSYVRIEDGGIVTMSYYLENGVVQRMSLRYRQEQ